MNSTVNDHKVGLSSFARMPLRRGKRSAPASLRDVSYGESGTPVRFRTTLVSLNPDQDTVEQWRALGARALVPNIFYEVEFAQAAALPFGNDVKLLTVHAEEGGVSRMVAAWPVRVLKFRWGVPLRVLAGWGHPFSASGVPLLDKDCAESALSALLAARKTIRGLPRRAFIPLVPDEGPFREVLDRVQARHGLRVSRTETHDRSYWRRGQADDPLASLSSGSRSKLRQEYRRLERGGPVVLETITDRAALVPALDDYLALEMKGWKGRVGTAIPQSMAETAFMKQSTDELAKQGRVQIDRLRQGDDTLAASITYFNGDHAWYAKISYNEEHAKNSPGSQLVLKITEKLLEDGLVDYADSCAPPLHPLMRKFWRDRFWLSNLTLEMVGGDPLFAPAAGLERLRPRIRDLVHRLRARLAARGAHKEKPGADAEPPSLEKSNPNEI